MPNQRLELTWIGKGIRPNLEPRILLEDQRKSYHAPHRVTENDIFDNMLIHGDNLLALKALEQDYTGKVKCIYIDPPYNTGSAFVHYDDGVEHSIWLSLMRDRLEILRTLLREDGSIFVSCDKNEVHYLKVMMDELFGRKTFIADISWQRTYSTRNDAKGIVTEVEHILSYSKNTGWMPNKLARTAEMNAKYKNPDNDFAPWRSDNPFAPGAATHQGMVYAIQHPFTGKMLYPSTGACWRYQQNDMFDIMQGWCAYKLEDLHDAKERAAVCGIDENAVRQEIQSIVLAESLDISASKAQAVLKRGQWPRFYFTKNGNGGIARKTYLENVGGKLPTNFWTYAETGHTDEAKKEILALFGSAVFDTPKPERLIQRILHIATNPGDLVLDSFLGSGTTAAVAHKMGRRWIGIELGEHCYTHCIPRLQKVINGEDPGGITKTQNWQGGGGFRFYELAPSLIKRDPWDIPVINPAFNAEMLAEAICKLHGYRYAPSADWFWMHGEGHKDSYIFVTTQTLTTETLQYISDQVGDTRSLLICCPPCPEADAELFPNLTLSIMPNALLKRYEWDHDDYSLNVKNLPQAEPPQATPPVGTAQKGKGKKARSSGQPSLLDFTGGAK